MHLLSNSVFCVFHSVEMRQSWLFLLNTVTCKMWRSNGFQRFLVPVYYQETVEKRCACLNYFAGRSSYFYYLHFKTRVHDPRWQVLKLCSCRCQMNFCGWCLEAYYKSSEDAHNHVGACERKPADAVDRYAPNHSNIFIFITLENQNTCVFTTPKPYQCWQ